MHLCPGNWVTIGRAVVYYMPRHLVQELYVGTEEKYPQTKQAVLAAIYL